MCYGNLRDKLIIKHKKIERLSNNEKREFSTESVSFPQKYA